MNPDINVARHYTTAQVREDARGLPVWLKPGDLVKVVDVYDWPSLYVTVTLGRKCVTLDADQLTRFTF